MTITTTKSWKNYMTLCRTLDRNDIEYEREDDNLCVKCNVSGRDIELSFWFTINPSKMLITLYSPVPIKLIKDKTADMALAICMINNALEDGSFCLDICDELIYFKMTSSFYETKVNDSMFEYMLSTAADIIDEYYPRLKKLAGSEQPYKDNEETGSELAVYFQKKMLEEK